MLPKISIVTPNFNQGKYIEETILSVINQGYENLEYIIIDGGSTDESVDIIKKYEKHLKYWVSEPDKGQADAINKGLQHCTGDIFNWINSDDLLAKNALNVISELYEPGLTIAGKVFNFYQDNAELNDYTQNQNINYKDFLNLKSVYHQPGIWVDLKAIKEIELDVKSHYYFDFFFYINYLKQYTEIRYTDAMLANFRVHSQSKTTLIQADSKKEIVEFYENLYQVAKKLEDKKSIRKVLRYWEALDKIKSWNDRNLEQPDQNNFLKFVLLNTKYLTVNFFWKFVIKYIFDYKNIRTKK